MATKAIAKPAAQAPASKSPSMKLMKGGATPAPATETKTTTKAVETAQENLTEGAASLETEDLIIKTAHEIENLKEDKAFKLVPMLLDNIDHDYFKLGGVLSVIQAQGWYMDKGYENFRAFVETEYGMQYRKAMYLIAIYNGLVESGVSWEKVKHLGWTKLKELAAILTPENVDDWVTKAESLTVLQLLEHIKSMSAATPKEAGAAGGAAADAAVSVTTMTFKLHPDQKETIREALDKCKHESGTDVDTVALENICLNFLGGDSKLKALPTLKELMTGKSAEEVLEVFGECFPNVELTATVTE